MSLRHDHQYVSWFVQKNRRRRQNEVGPVTFALLGELDSNVSPALIPHPTLDIEGGHNYESVSWDSSDFDVIDFNTDQTPLRFNLKAPGTATVTLTFHNADGSEYVTSKEYTVV